MHSRTTTFRGEPARFRRVALLAAAATVAAALTLPFVARAQRANAEPPSLRGSKASVERMYDFALRYKYPFYLTPANVDDAAAAGRLVPLTGDSTYELTRGVGFSYATREARQFVTLFAPQYLAACGTPLTLTSAARPLSRQPRNANPHSVHPTGIAVDIRRPPPGPCLTWVRGALAELEARGIVEATEEHHPVHLHVAVLQPPGATVKLPDLTHGAVLVRRQATESVVVARNTAPTSPRALLAPPPTAPSLWSAAAGEVSLWPASLGLMVPHR